MMWCGPLHLAFPGDVAYVCTNIQQVAKKKKKKKKVALHILTHGTRVWVDFFGGLH